VTTVRAGATATVEHMHVRWRGAAPQRRAALIDALLNSALPDALASLGLGEHAEVCLRSVEVAPVIAVPHEPDDAVADRWASRVAAAIDDAVQAGDAVVFRSPHHALGDMAVGVSRGFLGRAWAWRAAGVWPEGIGASFGDPVAGSASSDALVDRVAGASAAGLGAPAAADVVVPARSTTLRNAPTDRSSPPLTAPAGAPKVVGEAQRRPSPAPAPMGRTAPHPPPLPALVVPVVYDAGTRHEWAAPDSPVPDRASPPARPDGDHRRGGAAPRWPETDLEAAAEALTAALLLHPEAAAGVLAHVARLGLLPALEARLGPTRLAALPVAAQRPARPTPSSFRVDDVAAEARTEWGGLLLLLHLVEGEPEPDMYALGTILLTGLMDDEDALDPRDPALLAFSGLAPDDDPPAWLDPAGTTDLQPVLDRLRHLGLDLEQVCRRQAIIIADPGWLEARFSLDDVDVDIRRAGLDLDPGWLPWLGVVVRFTYA
jgi:hypothetical protein